MFGGMEGSRPDRKPGDLILDRYLPNATPAEREEARENLRAFAEVVFSVERRRALSHVESTHPSPLPEVESSERLMPPS